MNGVIRYKHSSSTIKGIVEKMKNDVVLFKSVNGINNSPYRRYDKLIRWGCVASISSNIQYNSPKAISNSSNKYKSRIILQDKKVPIPKTYNHNEIPYSFPVIGRPYKHAGGKNFFLCRNWYEYLSAIQKGAEYFTELYPKTKEYRVHVAHSKVIIMAEKIADNNQYYKAWNLNDRGICSRFNTLRWSDYDNDICKIAVDAVRALGLDFGAVDMITSPLNDRFLPAVVLEVNTAPKLGDYGQSRYAEYFDWLLKFPYKPRHFKHMEGGRYSFRHEDFRRYDVGFDRQE